MRRMALVFCLLLLHPGIAAATRIEGLAFTVASDMGYGPTGTHFHSDSTGVFGNPPGLASVGFYHLGFEALTGNAEFLLPGATDPLFASLSFRVFNEGGLVSDENDEFPLLGTIRVLAYEGNGLEDVGDFEAPAFRTVGAFSTTPLSRGDRVVFDVSDIVTEAMGRGFGALGIRLEPGIVSAGEAFTFHDFSLAITGIPEPSTGLALGLGVICLSGLFRKRPGRCGTRSR